MPQANQTKILELSKMSKIVFVILLIVFVATGLTTLWLLNTNSQAQPLINIVTSLGLFSE